MAQSRVQCAVRYLEYFIFVASGAVLLAVQAVLDDPGFEVSSPLAANAVQTAKRLQEWSQSVENKLYFDGFASQLVSEPETAFWPSSGGHKRLRVQREKMWGQYHLIRSSAVFREMWLGILLPLHGCTPCPIFYQYVTDNVFKQLCRDLSTRSASQSHGSKSGTTEISTSRAQLNEDTKIEKKEQEVTSRTICINPYDIHDLPHSSPLKREHTNEKYKTTKVRNMPACKIETH